MPEYKLIYFNMKGRAEAIRMIFAHAGVAYEDYRMEGADWPAMKEKTPFGQVPVLEVDGKQLSQTMAICRYLAKQFGLTGQNDWESAMCDMLGDGMQDIIANFLPWFREQDPEKKKEILENIKNDHVKPGAAKFEKFLVENGTGYYVGSDLTWTDLLLFTIEQWWSAMFTDVMDAQPKMKEHAEKIAALPNIKKWIETRPETAN